MLADGAWPPHHAQQSRFSAPCGPCHPSTACEEGEGKGRREGEREWGIESEGENENKSEREKLQTIEREGSKSEKWGKGNGGKRLRNRAREKERRNKEWGREVTQRGTRRTWSSDRAGSPVAAAEISPAEPARAHAGLAAAAVARETTLTLDLSWVLPCRCLRCAWFVMEELKVNRYAWAKVGHIKYRSRITLRTWSHKKDR